MPAFIPTHYTRSTIVFYGTTYYDQRVSQPHEAVMTIDGPNPDGRVKVCDGDGRTAWVRPDSDLYTGPRRSELSDQRMMP